MEGSELLEGQNPVEISNRNEADRGHRELAKLVQGNPSERERIETDPAYNNLGPGSQLNAAS